MHFCIYVFIYVCMHAIAHLLIYVCMHRSILIPIILSADCE